MTGFDALHPAVQHHIVNTLGWLELRPLQEQAIAPLLGGSDALLLAPTAGGKTEAAMFPLLTRMAAEDWRGTSLLYVCPLRALLNNLEPRIDAYARWLGRRASVRHGDTRPSARKRQLVDRHEVLLTTPESLEAMLVSATIDPHVALANVRAVVVDEVHAFAGDDRGWHLLAVLERVAGIAGRPLQRVGLSATVGNPTELLAWLQGTGRGTRPAQVVMPAAVGPSEGTDLQLDYVGSLDNAGRVISELHGGEKRLVFADSRRAVEQVSVRLRELGTEVHVSHSSLSPVERRRSEQAFAESRNCVIAATSTLELGIDVGDLDRVVQIGSPGTVASFLQRLGRTGRRPGTLRNMLFLAPDDNSLLQAAGLCLLWSEGFVEPIAPPPEPNHIAAQQLLALALQERALGRNELPGWLDALGFTVAATVPLLADGLVASGHLDLDEGLLFVGPEAERRYGRRHFMELMSVFTSDPQFTILHGRQEIGTVDPLTLLARMEGPHVILLAGRAWRVTAIDWSRRRAFVETTDLPGKSRWNSSPVPLSFELADAMRRALLGADPVGLHYSRRATASLERLRHERAVTVDADRSVVVRDGDDARWWTWAGARANTHIAAALTEASPGTCDDRTLNNFAVGLNPDAEPGSLTRALRRARERFGPRLEGLVPPVPDAALDGLKFSDLLPRDLARRTLAARLQDRLGAAAVLSRGITVRTTIS